MIDLTLSTVAGTIESDKPIVIILLQGEHHLVLYENIFKLCTGFRWVCVLPDVAKLSTQLIFRFYNRYGVQFFSDHATALANFHAIDAVVTTFAIPHRAHLKFVRFIALAEEIGIPVFELQHGLFQLGISASEVGPIIGSGMANALTALPAPNLVGRQLRWNGIDSIGYPPYSDDIFAIASQSRRVTDPTLITTNLHWNIFTPADVVRISDIIAKAVLSLPDVDFIHIPHPSELSKPHMNELATRLMKAGATNYSIQRPKNSAEMVEAIVGARVCLSTISTMLLDMEMMNTPTLVMPGQRQHDMVARFEHSVSVYDKGRIADELKNIYYHNSNPLIITGALQPFSPSKLTQTLKCAIEKNPRSKELGLIVRAVAKYIG